MFQGDGVKVESRVSPGEGKGSFHVASEINASSSITPGM